jgi:hypothetical protein
MVKRTDRLKPIQHNIGQLENLKTLDPIATPDNVKPMSDALVDIAIEALMEVYHLEDGKKPNHDHLREIITKVNALIS